MRLSQYFLPILREDPKEAEIVSHRLMLRAGMIRQSSAGIYNWLPLGMNVLQRITQIVREEQNRAGGVEMLMPTLQPADIWRESGRYDDYGDEMLRITDRHNRQMLYGPTNEEAITTVVRGSLASWRDLPHILYHIQWKFRDEVRPRFGVMRGREFFMKDAYSFDIDMAAAKHSYNRMFIAYLRTYARMGLMPIPMRATTGPIGGDLSHEFIVLADTGESQVFCDRALLDRPAPSKTVDYSADLENTVSEWTTPYAATDEKHDQAEFDKLVPSERQVSARGIEVGQLFYFGTKYSEAMKAAVQGKNGEQIPLHMGSYGVGVSRLVGAIIETSHDERGIIWPESVAPFKVGLIQLRTNDDASAQQAQTIATQLENAGVEVLWDDTNDSAGAKFSRMDLIGLPYQIIVGPRGAAQGQAEVKDRRTDVREEMSTQAAINRFTAQ